jgi:hypothetical protein
MDWKPGCGLPSPQEIRERADAISAAWSPLERAKRRVGTPEAITVVRVKVDDLRA